MTLALILIVLGLVIALTVSSALGFFLIGIGVGLLISGAPVNIDLNSRN